MKGIIIMKNTKHLIGSIISPLNTGSPAIIEVSAGTMRTSPVVHCITNPNGEAHIETKNSIYVVHPDRGGRR